MQKAQLYIDSLFLLSKEHNFTKGIGMAMLNQGLSELIRGNFDQAIQHNKKALAIFQGLKNDTLTAKTYQALGSNYWQKGEYDKALQYQLKALEINEHLKLANETAACYNAISMIYQSKNKLIEAEELANKAKSVINEKKPHRSHISILHNLANIEGMKGNYQEAMKLDSIGLIYCEQLNNEFNKSMFYDNMANCYYFQNNYAKSIEYHLKTITIDSSFGNNKQLGDSYFNLAVIFEEQKMYDAAEKYYLKSIALCRSSGYKNGLKNALTQLSKMYFDIKQQENAYLLLQQSILVKDSMINEKTEQKIAELQTLFDTEKKKKQITEQQLKISRRNILLLTLSAILTLSLVTFFLLYNRNKLKQEQKLQQELLLEEEKRTKAILETEENERQRLARELHDGVGQLLSAAKLNLSSLTTTDTSEIQTLRNSMEIIDESIKEIRNISHNMVPDVLQKAGLKLAIEHFISKLNPAKETKIHFECNNFDENSLNDSGKLMLYRIIQESVNNALKYANAKLISIQLSADESEISLMIQDNGKGFDTEEIKRKNGIGMRNIQLRSDYLNGKLDIESSPKNGTTIIVEIPLSKENS